MDLYHVLNRGVDKRTIFIDQRDYVRFVHGLYEFNDRRRVNNILHTIKNKDIGSPYLKTGRKKEHLVDVHGWCLMKNHYHLLLSERSEGGMSLFLQKLNIGYAKYFNEKYTRVGTLFQGRTKKILIEKDAHFLHILNYIHLNPLDYMQDSAEWRSRHIKSVPGALAYLEKYRWSSYLDYCDKKNFPSIVETRLFKEVFGNYRDAISKYVKDLDIDTIKPMLLE